VGAAVMPMAVMAEQGARAVMRARPAMEVTALLVT